MNGIIHTLEALAASSTFSVPLDNKTKRIAGLRWITKRRGVWDKVFGPPLVSLRRWSWGLGVKG